MADEEFDQPSLLDVINHAEDLLRGLKSQVVAAGDNAALAASSVVRKNGECQKLSTALLWLRERAEETSMEVWEDISAFLEDYERWPHPLFWEAFHEKLKDLGEADVDYRRRCLFRTLGPGGTLFHGVCELNPPPEVVKTLIQITPPARKSDGEEANALPFPYESGREFNHLARCKVGGELPLHRVMRHGGTVDLVKLLVSAHADSLGGDRKRERMCVLSSWRSLIHILADNKDSHHPHHFSQILRYLILIIGPDEMMCSPLTHQFPYGKLPVEILWLCLRREGLSNEEILRNSDFIFLLKATYYHTDEYHIDERKGITDLSVRQTEIEAVEFSRAFLLSSPCFGRAVTSQVLQELYSVDRKLFLEKDTNGMYLIHALLRTDRSYIMDRHGSDFGFKSFLVGAIVRMVPQCARQIDDKGLLPVHIVADVGRYAIISESNHLSLLKTLLEAYPEALDTRDRELGIPLFALPVRGMSKADGQDASRFFWDDNYSVSCAYFLLRMQPEFLSGPAKFIKRIKAVPKTKRQCTCEIRDN